MVSMIPGLRGVRNATRQAVAPATMILHPVGILLSVFATSKEFPRYGL